MKATTLILLAVLLILSTVIATTYAESDAESILLKEVAESADASDASLQLTEKTFQPTLEASGKLMVMFYAPWCGHCKQLHPTWEKAAVQLKEKLTLAKVDCTVQQELCTKFKIEGFPTVKLFNKDGSSVEYTGDRTLNDIEKFANKATQPLLTPIATEAELEAFTAQQPVSFVFVGDDSTRQLAEGIAQALIASHAFGFVTNENKAAVKKYTTETPAIIAIAPDDMQVLSGERFDDSDVFAKFVAENQFGLVPELSPSNFGEIQKLKKPITIIALKASDIEGKERILGIARTAAAKHRAPFAYAWLNAEQWGKYLSTHYHVHDDELPQAIILDHIGNKYYRTQITDEPALSTFLAGVDNGSVQPTYLDPELNKTELQKFVQQIEDYIKAFPLYVTVSAFFIGFVVGKIPLGSRQAKKRVVKKPAGKSE